jgi:uncharacterized membrane protein YdjX (TVP38/TMEM64 family)
MKMEKTLLGDLLRFGGVVCFFAGLACILRYASPQKDVIERASLWFGHLHDHDMTLREIWTLCVFILGGGAAVCLGVPRIWISSLGGAIYGSVFGVVWSLLASILGAIGHYWLGRTLLSGLAERILQKYGRNFQPGVKRSAFVWVLLARLFPISNSTAVGLICGSLCLPVHEYLWGTLLGFIPMAAIFAIYGSGSVQGDIVQIVLGSCLLIMLFAIQQGYKKRAAGPK